MTQPQQSCGTCKWSEWSGRGVSDRHKKLGYGRCHFPLAPVPSCYSTNFQKMLIHIDDGQSCPCYTAKDAEKG